MTETAAAAPETKAERMTPKPLPTLGRIVWFTDPFGKMRAAIITKVSAPEHSRRTGEVNLVAFAAELGEEPAVSEFNVGYDPDGRARTWRYPERK